MKKLKPAKHDPRQILEPLTTIISLAIISFKEIGTKIAVSSNKIYIQPPNVIQGPMRWTYGNNREEIHYLLKPIVRAIVIYNPKDNPDIRKIFTYAVKGLSVLKNSYNNFSSTLCHAIELYINLINYSFLHEDLTDKYEDVQLHLNTNLNMSETSKINLNKLFVDVWSDAEIKIIAEMLELSVKDSKYIDPIEAILRTKKEQTNTIISSALQML